MSKPQDRTVSKQPDDRWENKRNDASRVSSLHDTQKAAQDAARELLKKQAEKSSPRRVLMGRFAIRTPSLPGTILGW